MSTIVVDTSALMAILLDEPSAERCVDALAQSDTLLLSSATVAEALVVAGRRGCRDGMERLLARLGAEIVALAPGDAPLVADAYDRWGKGVHPAGLNLGDCFAYALAKSRGCPLLFVGEDFARTDLAIA